MEPNHGQTRPVLLVASELRGARRHLNRNSKVDKCMQTPGVAPDSSSNAADSRWGDADVKGSLGKLMKHGLSDRLAKLLVTELKPGHRLNRSMDRRFKTGIHKTRVLLGTREILAFGVNSGLTQLQERLRQNRAAATERATEVTDYAWCHKFPRSKRCPRRQQ
jgi:hypothetical protein